MKLSIERTTYSKRPYICAVKHNYKTGMVKRLFRRYIQLLGVQPWTIWVYRVW